MKKCLISSFLIFLFGCGITMNRKIPDQHMRVRDFLDRHIEENKIHGMQYLLMDSAQTLFEYSGGWADIKNKKPMKLTTTMMAYSMTKTITAAAVLQLIGNGYLQLDDPVSVYLNDIPYGNALKIKHLLSQTSGITNPLPLRWVHLAEEHATFDEQAALKKILQENSELDFIPGSKYAYSNLAYWLLGKIIERTSGMSYETYVSTHILAPLNISPAEICFLITDIDNHAKGYLYKYSFFNLIKGFLMDKKFIGAYEGNWLHINNHYLNSVASGGLVGTTPGFAKFLQDQLRKKSLLFDRLTKALFYRQYKNNQGDLIDMTYGWHIGNDQERDYFFKEGGGGGYHSEMRLYPQQGLASIVMVNKTNFDSREFLNQVDRELVVIKR